MNEKTGKCPKLNFKKQVISTTISVEAIEVKGITINLKKIDK